MYWCCSSAGERNRLIMNSRNRKWWGTDCTEQHTMYNTHLIGGKVCLAKFVLLNPMNFFVIIFDHTLVVITLTTECLPSSTMNRWLNKCDPSRPPYIAALFSPTVVSVKSEHGGGACPVTLSELHPPGGDDIISHYNTETTRYHSLVDKQKMCCSLVRT